MSRVAFDSFALYPLAQIARSKHALKLAAVRLAWYDAAPDHVPEDEEIPGEERVGGGKEDLEALQSRTADEEANLQRLRLELAENKGMCTLQDGTFPPAAATRLSL